MIHEQLASALFERGEIRIDRIAGPCVDLVCECDVRIQIKIAPIPIRVFEDDILVMIDIHLIRFGTSSLRTPAEFCAE